MNKGFYTHPKFKDIFMEVLHVPYSDSKRVKAKVIWWNWGFVGNPFPITLKQNWKFTQAKFREFKKFAAYRQELSGMKREDLCQ